MNHSILPLFADLDDFCQSFEPTFNTIHTRHRSRVNFLVNVIAALIAYRYKEKLPSLNLRVKELSKLLPAVLSLYRTHVKLNRRKQNAGEVMG